MHDDGYDKFAFGLGMRFDLMDSKAEVVIQELTRRIRTGGFGPGQRLIESELMQSLNVSRNVLREAFRSLAEARLIDVRHNYGASVRRLSREDVINLYLTREPLEGMAARLCAVRCVDVERARLEQTVSDLDAAIDAENINLFFDLNGEFHTMISTLSRNPEISRLLERLSTPIIRFQARALIDRKVIRRSQTEHGSIVQAIAEADADAAERRMRQHVRNGLDLVLAHMDRNA